jgi:hypothetical protein
MPFQPGQSGNPAGRPPGARNKRTLLLENLMENEAESIALAAIGKAKAGDMAAIRMVLDRLAPACRERPIDFELPPLAAPADAVRAMAAIIAGLAAGELTPSEAESLSKVVDRYVRALEATEFETRLTELENEATK